MFHSVVLATAMEVQYVLPHSSYSPSSYQGLSSMVDTGYKCIAVGHYAMNTFA
jgi:hypothetical protein